MKSLIKFPTIMVGLLLLLFGTTQNAKAQYDDVSLQTFYDELSPYGTWINDPEYGYVWRPDVDQGEFRPYYTNGRWVMTEYGNTWVSNYDWGWAPFHYGRWTYNRYNRWIWIPDTVWGPAWVSWRSGGGYYGWAPLTPGFGVSVNIGIADFYWNFIPTAHIYYTSFPRYYSGRNRVYVQNTVIINNTYIHNNRTYYTGPRVDDIRRATRQNVTVYNVSRVTNRTGGNSIVNNTVNIYAPRPNRGSDNAKAAPRQAVQGSITRDRIERGGVVTREERGNNNFPNRENRSTNDRNGTNNGSVFGRGRERSNVNTNEQNNRQNSANTPSTQENRSNTTPNSETNNGSVFGRSRENFSTSEQRSNNGSNSSSAVTPPATQERSRPTFPSRSSSSEGNTQQYTPPQRSIARPERQERVERPQPQRTERFERPQQSSGSSSRSSEATNTGRASRGESSGRPGRG